jgi:hypothetical protein
MPDEMHTLESFAALPDDESRDAAIARACGCTQEALPSPGCWYDGGMPHGQTPPMFFSGGDADPFANWHLLAEVVMALDAAGWSIDFVSRDHPRDLWAIRIQRWQPQPRAWTGELDTPHRMACEAAVVAGLVPKGGA